MLRVSFSTMATARAAASVLEAYGYSAEQFGREVVTDCPTLLALPAIQKMVGFSEVERLDLGGALAHSTAAPWVPPGSVSRRAPSDMRA